MVDRIGHELGLDVEFVDITNLDQLRAAMRSGKTRLVWLETLSNPMWEVIDIAAVSAIAHEAGARIAVDSTVAPPVMTRPIEHGANLVMHSATKYLNGHGDVVAGALVCREQDAFWNRITAWRRDGGAVLGPFEAWLLLRGMRTLFVRVQHCSETALTIARHFHGHPKLSMAVSLCSSCPVMRRRTRLERNQCRLLFTQELRELAAR